MEDIVRLEMHQAGKGDLLRFVCGERSVIVDSGTSKYASTLRELLAEKTCELFVLTHLDADHFGGLRKLVQQVHDGEVRDVRWPAKILVNQFEAEMVINAIREAVGPGGEREIGETVNLAIAEAMSWREQNGIHIAGDISVNEDAELRTAIVNADDAAFEYIRATESRDERAFTRPDWFLLHDFALKADEQELHRLLHDRRLYPRSIVEQAPERDVLLLGRTIVVRRASSRTSGTGVRIRGSNRSITKTLDEEDVSIALPQSIRGLLHMQRRGTPILDSIKEATEAITLIEALRRISPLQHARAGDSLVPTFDGALRLHIMGPDREELDLLRKNWEEVRERGRIHTNLRHLAFLEASLFAADAGHYEPDTSVTNRSSIQLFAETDRASAVLTGDGRPDTLERVLANANLPDRRCRVFKAAHHGSDHNIDIRQLPNRILSRFKPEAIWVSGGDPTHPALGFLRYLHAHANPPRLLITNRNEHVTAMEDEMAIEVMHSSPSVCEL